MHGIPWKNLHSPITVLDTSPDPVEAEHMLHGYAERIKRLNQTERFGVFLRKCRGVYQVVLMDRFAAKRAQESSKGDQEGALWTICNAVTAAKAAA